MVGVDVEVRRRQVEPAGQGAALEVAVAEAEEAPLVDVGAAVDAEGIEQRDGVVHPQQAQVEAGRRDLGHGRHPPAGLVHGAGAGQAHEGAGAPGQGGVGDGEVVGAAVQGDVVPAVAPGAVLEQHGPGALDGGIGQVEGFGAVVVAQRVLGLVGGGGEQGHAADDQSEDEHGDGEQDVAPLPVPVRALGVHVPSLAHQNSIA
ncbi:MAG: hypothetical protein IPI34_05065 [bacterium]|nr:hypothetical protein [bacterium]